MHRAAGAERRISAEAILQAGCCGMFFFLPVATSPTVICGLLVLFVWLFSGRFLRDIPAWRYADTALPVVLLILLPWVGLLYTPVPADGLPVALKSHYWLYAVACAPVVCGMRQRNLPIRGFLAGLFINSLVAILQFAGLVPLKKGLTTGLLGGSSAHIAFSLLLTTGILISSFYFFRAGSRNERLFYGLLITQYFATIGFVGGRSGYIALILLFPLVIHNIIGRRRMAVTLIACVVLGAVLFSFPVVRSRFAAAASDISRYQSGDINTSLGHRFHMWRIALEEIRSHPVIGIGTSGFRQAWELHKADPLLPFYDHPHNSFLYQMVSFGITGLIAFCWLLIALLRKGWRFRDSAPGFSVLSFAAVFVVGSLSDTQLLPFATAMALPLFTGISEAIRDN